MKSSLKAVCLVALLSSPVHAHHYPDDMPWLTGDGMSIRNGSSTFHRYSTPEGPATGTSSRVGNTTFHRFSTPRGPRTGTSTRIGNFTFHRFSGSHSEDEGEDDYEW